MKLFYKQENIGKARYVVNHHDGFKRHKDGSPFFDINLFSNRAKMKKFIRDLERRGYTCQH